MRIYHSGERGVAYDGGKGRTLDERLMIDLWAEDDKDHADAL